MTIVGEPSGVVRYYSFRSAKGAKCNAGATPRVAVANAASGAIRKEFFEAPKDECNPGATPRVDPRKCRLQAASPRA